MRVRLLVALAALCAWGVGCRITGAPAAPAAPASDDKDTRPFDGAAAPAWQPRRLDVAPVASELVHPLPPGHAEAHFEFDTGGDIMGAPAKEAGLVVVVRYDRRELRQVIASCAAIAKGSALGDVTYPVLDFAGCAGWFRLIHRANQVVVERENDDAGASAVTSIPLPASIHVVTGSSP